MGLTNEFSALESLSLINVGLTSLKGFPELSSLKKVCIYVYIYLLQSRFKILISYLSKFLMHENLLSDIRGKMYKYQKIQFNNTIVFALCSWS